MTGIYILDTEMPKNCYECQFAANYFRPIHTSGREPCRFACVLTQKASLTLTKRSRFCPLVAVPDHARLIDADALHYAIAEKYRNGVGVEKITYQDVTEEIYNAPAIIEVERKEE